MAQGIVDAGRLHPLGEARQQPVALSGGGDTRRMRCIGDFADDVLHRTPAKLRGFGPRNHPVEKAQRAIFRGDE